MHKQFNDSNSIIVGSIEKKDISSDDKKLRGY